jgi:O-antigen ligase
METDQAKLSPLNSSVLLMAEEAPREGVSLAATVLAIYTFLLIGRLPDAFPSLRLALITAGITSVLALTLPRSKGQGLLQSSEVRAALGLLALAVMVTPFSVWPGGSFKHVIDVQAKLILFFLLLIHCVRSLREANRVMWGFFGAVLFNEVGSLFLGVEERVRVLAFYDKNDIAFVMVCAIPLTAFLFVKGRGVVKYLSGTITMLAAVTIVHTGSRGGFIGLILTAAILFIRTPSRRPLVRAVFLLVCIILFAIFTPESYWNRIATIWGGGEGEDALSDYDKEGIVAARWTLWMTGVRLMLENPVFGVGSGLFMTAEGMSHGGKGGWMTAHNSFLQIGAELGLLGLALFIFLLTKAIKNCRMVIHRARDDAQIEQYLWLAHGLEISLYAFIIAGFSLSQGYSNLLYFLLGMSVVLKRLVISLEQSKLFKEDHDHSRFSLRFELQWDRKELV